MNTLCRKVRNWGAVAVAAIPFARGLAQGDLAPPGPPGPTQKSLQDLWDKLDTVDLTTQALWMKVDMLQQQVAGQQGMLYNAEEQTAKLSALLLSIGTAAGALPWRVTTVGAPGAHGGHPSLVFTAEGYPAISHYDIMAGTLAFSWYDGTAWQTETVDDSAPLVGKYTSLAIAPDGRRAISYYDETNQRIRCALYHDAAWHTGTVASVGYDTSGTGGYYSSAKFTPDGRPAVAFYDNNFGTLKYATHDGTNWVSAAVTTSGGGGEFCSLAFTPAGHPAISYHQHEGAVSDLMYAEYDGAAWQITPLDITGSVGMWSSLAIAPNGRIAISYFDQSNTDLKCYVADETSSAWYTVDTDNGGSFTSITLSPSGLPAISYLNSAGEVKFAHFNGATWSTSVVARYSATGPIETSVAYGPDGEPAIAFYDHRGYRVRLAVRTPYAAP